MKRIILYSITVVLLGFLMGGCKGKKSMLKKEGRITKSDDLIKDVSKQEIMLVWFKNWEGNRTEE